MIMRLHQSVYHQVSYENETPPISLSSGKLWNDILSISLSSGNLKNEDVCKKLSISIDLWGESEGPQKVIKFLVLEIETRKCRSDNL